MTAGATDSRRRVAVAATEPAPPAPPGPPEYEGLVTRGIAFALDAAIISAVAVIVGAGVAVSLSVLSVPGGVESAIFAVAGAVCALWSIAYFVTFWSATGQTPGNRLLRIRVRRADADLPPTAGLAVVRLAMLTLSAIPLGAGFLPILFDDRRRGLHDIVAGTVVVGDDGGEKRLAADEFRTRPRSLP